MLPLLVLNRASVSRRSPRARRRSRLVLWPTW